MGSVRRVKTETVRIESAEPEEETWRNFRVRTRTFIYCQMSRRSNGNTYPPLVNRHRRICPFKKEKRVAENPKNADDAACSDGSRFFLLTISAVPSRLVPSSSYVRPVLFDHLSTDRPAIITFVRFVRSRPVYVTTDVKRFPWHDFGGFV